MNQETNGKTLPRFYSAPGVKIYERIMQTSTGQRLAGNGEMDYARNFDVSQRIRGEIAALYDTLMLGDNGTIDQHFTLGENMLVYGALLVGAREAAQRLAARRARERLRTTKQQSMSRKLEELITYCTVRAENCDQVLEELNGKLSTASDGVYQEMERARNLQTVLREYEQKMAELKRTIKQSQAQYKKRYAAEMELSSLDRDYTSVAYELDDANFSAQTTRKEVDDLNVCLDYLNEVRANTFKHGQGFKFLAKQARRKVVNISHYIIEPEKLLEGASLAREQSRIDGVMNTIMARTAELCAATFGEPLPPGEEAVEEFAKRRKAEIARIKKDFEENLRAEQERLKKRFA